STETCRPPQGRGIDRDRRGLLLGRRFIRISRASVFGGVSGAHLCRSSLLAVDLHLAKSYPNSIAVAPPKAAFSRESDREDARGGGKPVRPFEHLREILSRFYDRTQQKPGGCHARNQAIVPFLSGCER